jgi:hypothetical protein
MAGTTKHKAKAKDRHTPVGKHPVADSVDREPSGQSTPAEHGLPVGKHDEPTGYPTSERFHTEQAHRKSGKGS